MAPSKAPAVRLRYANRKSNGMKVATIVSRDLRKHAASFDRKKHPSDVDSAPLELDLEHKEQTDKCVAEFTVELRDTIMHRDGRPSPLRLEELGLRNNALTTASLRLLAPVIHAARYDLRDVDISQNSIKVETSQEAEDWEIFLEAFAECEVLRRLDVSANNLSGSLAFEIFLRVYCGSHPVDPSEVAYERPPSAEMSVLCERTNNMQVSPKAQHCKDGSDGSTVTNDSIHKGRILQRRKGLRSVPYIVLRNCNLDDAGALHLSYVLENHFWPQYLMTKLKEGSKEAKRQEEDDVDGVFGIIYNGNTSLTYHGMKLLEYTNSSRASLSGIHSHTESTPESSWVDAIQTPRFSDRLPLMRTRKSSLQSLSDGSGDRRVSTPLADISSLRMRLQRTTIERVNVYGVQLWHAAFKFLYVARVILPRATDELDTSPRYAAKITAASTSGQQSIFAVTEESSTPTKPTFTRQPVDSPVERRSLLANDTTSGSRPPNGTSERNQVLRPLPMDATTYRDDDNPCGLPTSIWQNIFSRYAGAKDVLNAQQQESITYYARDRSNIMREAQSRVKGESHQVWKILNEMDCVTYELKMAGE